MKKMLLCSLVFVFIFTMSMGVLSAPAPKIAAVTLSASAINVTLGQTVTLTAATLKQGSSYSDSWSGATKISTMLDEATGSYISTAAFSAATPGTYTISYSITMGAGKSTVAFNGADSITITVTNPASITGAAAKNVIATPKYNNQGHLTGYDSTADIYALWSNGAETFYGTVNFNFSPNQTSRNIDVLVDGNTYTVRVER